MTATPTTEVTGYLVTDDVAVINDRRLPIGMSTCRNCQIWVLSAWTALVDGEPVEVCWECLIRSREVIDDEMAWIDIDADEVG